MFAPTTFFDGHDECWRRTLNPDFTRLVFVIGSQVVAFSSVEQYLQAVTTPSSLCRPLFGISQRHNSRRTVGAPDFLSVKTAADELVVKVFREDRTPRVLSGVVCPVTVRLRLFPRGGSKRLCIRDAIQTICVRAEVASPEFVFFGYEGGPAGLGVVTYKGDDGFAAMLQQALSRIEEPEPFEIGVIAVGERAPDSIRSQLRQQVNSPEFGHLLRLSSQPAFATNSTFQAHQAYLLREGPVAPGPLKPATATLTWSPQKAHKLANGMTTFEAWSRTLDLQLKASGISDSDSDFDYFVTQASLASHSEPAAGFPSVLASGPTEWPEVDLSCQSPSLPPTAFKIPPVFDFDAGTADAEAGAATISGVSPTRVAAPVSVGDPPAMPRVAAVKAGASVPSFADPLTPPARAADEPKVSVDGESAASEALELRRAFDFLCAGAISARKQLEKMDFKPAPECADDWVKAANKVRLVGNHVAHNAQVQMPEKGCYVPIFDHSGGYDAWREACRLLGIQDVDKRHDEGLRDAVRVLTTPPPGYNFLSPSPRKSRGTPTKSREHSSVPARHRSMSRRGVSRRRR